MYTEFNIEIELDDDQTYTVEDGILKIKIKTELRERSIETTIDAEASAELQSDALWEIGDMDFTVFNCNGDEMEVEE